MAAYDSGATGGDTFNGGLSSGLPVPAIVPLTGITNNAFTAATTATLEIVWNGAPTGLPSATGGFQWSPAVGSFELYAGTNSTGKAGTFVCRLDGNTRGLNSGAAVATPGSVEGNDKFTGGKLGSQAFAVSIPAASLNSNLAATLGYLTIVPVSGNHGIFACQLTGTID